MTDTAVLPRFSIITPMYNSFDLMGRYFESLENQSFSDFEVIIVDDCSSDNSLIELKKYVDISKLNISIYSTQSNGGPGVARNLGLLHAKGQWVTFIDNDDWVDLRLLEKINHILLNNDVNCVIYDYFIVNGSDLKIGRSMYKGENGIISVSDCIRNVRNHTVGKVYSRNSLTRNNVLYPALRRCEDVAFVCRAIAACGSVYYLKEPMYYYYQRANSLSNNKSLDERDMIIAFSILEDSLQSEYMAELMDKSVADLLYGVLLMMCKSKKSRKYIISYINKYEEKHSQWWHYECVSKLGFAKGLFLKAARYRFILVMKVLAYVHSKIIG